MSSHQHGAQLTPHDLILRGHHPSWQHKNNLLIVECKLHCQHTHLPLAPAGAGDWLRGVLSAGPGVSTSAVVQLLQVGYSSWSLRDPSTM